MWVIQTAEGSTLILVWYYLLILLARERYNVKRWLLNQDDRWPNVPGSSDHKNGRTAQCRCL